MADKYMKYIEGNGWVEMSPEEIAEIDRKDEESYINQKNYDMSFDEKLELLIASLVEDKTNKYDNGEVKTEPKIVDGVIVWLPTNERAGAGTLTNPKQYVQGDEVEEGVYYCIYKISAGGRPYAQLTNGTYKAIMSGTPSKFGAITHFENVL